MHFPEPCKILHLHKYFIFYSFFCSFERLLSSVVMYVTALKQNWHLNTLMPTQILKNLADSRYNIKFKIIHRKILKICLPIVGFLHKSVKNISKKNHRICCCLLLFQHISFPQSAYIYIYMYSYCLTVKP